VEIPPSRLRELHIDCVILQRPHEEALVRRWTGRNLPAVYVEHDTPTGNVPETRHPMADRTDLLLVHVTHFNNLMWDCGITPTRVVEHGIVDPGPLWTGEIPHGAVVVNEPLRRGRFVGTDLLPFFGSTVPLDVFGMGVQRLPGELNIPTARVFEDLPQQRMHEELSQRRVYLHPFRWTSLGLSLLEAMHLGMPVVALATTEAVEAVPQGAGVISTNPDVLIAAFRRLAGDHAEASEMGKAAREAVLGRYSLSRFLRDWDWVLREAVAR
jgi:hypothetical protein